MIKDEVPCEIFFFEKLSDISFNVNIIEVFNYVFFVVVKEIYKIIEKFFSNKTGNIRD